VTTNYQFLAQLHGILQPRGYLEIGVFAGGSLNLASCPAIGVDPQPHTSAQGQQRIYSQTADAFFAAGGVPEGFPPLDLAYIDGMHLFEFALRDFRNIAKHAHKDTVIVFDDVLPYNMDIAGRTPLPGDWAGDVWKLIPILSAMSDLKVWLTDVSPTGALVVKGADGDLSPLWDDYDQIVEDWIDTPCFDWVINRLPAFSPDSVLEDLR
jgi:methyltransferase family protein